MKKYLRSNERLATITDAEVCRNAAGGRVLCVALHADDGGALGDHFDFADPGNTRSTHEDHRREAFGKAVACRNGEPCVGKQVIVVLDDQGVISDYRPVFIPQG